MQTALKNNGTSTLAQVITITHRGILLSIPAGDFFLSYDKYPWFYGAKVEDVFQVEMQGDDAVRWENLDVDLEVESLIHPEKYPLIARSVAPAGN